MVGAVIVSETGEIIGEGFHEVYGGAHAEVNAVKNAKSDVKNSTIYVSLEPCAHHGKTPPCTDLIIKHKFKRLVYASHDPNSLVSGKGIAKILSHRIEVIGPEDLDPEIVAEANYLNRAFFKILNRESWITVKIAINENGEMITVPKQITNSNSQKDVHLIRASHQAVLTGSGTLIEDDPQLNVRFSAEELGLAQIKQPYRMVLTSNPKINLGDFKISQGEPRARLITNPHNTLDLSPNCQGQGLKLKAIISELRQEGISKIMVEAGPRLSSSFLDSGLVDELIVYQNTNNRELIKKMGLKLSPILIDGKLIPGKANERDDLRLCYKLTN